MSKMKDLKKLRDRNSRKSFAPDHNANEPATPRGPNLSTDSNLPHANEPATPRGSNLSTDSNLPPIKKGATSKDSTTLTKNQIKSRKRDVYIDADSMKNSFEAQNLRQPYVKPRTLDPIDRSPAMSKGSDISRNNTSDDRSINSFSSNGSNSTIVASTTPKVHKVVKTKNQGIQRSNSANGSRNKGEGRG